MNEPRDLEARLRHLSAGARRDLLRVLEADSAVRADVIRQFHDRGHAGIVEALVEFEADDRIRMWVIDALRRTESEAHG
jgi:hypothetical protein